MSYEIKLGEDIVQTVLRNLRKCLAENELFSGELNRDIPSALARLNEHIQNRKTEIQTIRLKESEMIKTKIKYKKFREVKPLQQTTQEKVAPMEKQIEDLNTVVKEIRSGVQANNRLKQKLEKEKKSAAIERKKTTYSELVSSFNEYRFPKNLVGAIKDLVDALHSKPLQEKILHLIAMPDRHEKLVELRAELEREECADGLYPIPEFTKELKDAAMYARSRSTSILGYDPKLFRLLFDEAGGHLVAANQPRRVKGSKAMEQNRERLAKENEAARKQLEAEGLI